MAKKDINAKIKKSLEKKEYTKDDMFDSLGIPKSQERPKEYFVYTLWEHDRATLDHVKYPNAHWRKSQDTTQFATWEEGHTYIKNLDNKDLYHECRITMMTLQDMSPNVRKKIQERIKTKGW